MKKILFCLSVMSLSFVQAQIVSPQPSPAATVIQAVGLSEVTLSYSRPAMRGRKIMGDLVPYNAIWRTGANANSTMSVSTDFEFAGTPVAAGTYAVYTKPSANNWEVYLYAKNDNWGAPAQWDESQIVATATVTPIQTNRVMSSFNMAIHEITNDSAHLEISWEQTRLAIPFSVPTDGTVLASIEKTLAGPSAADYYNAAVYYLNTGKDIDQSLEWMEKAMSEMEKPAFWQLRQQSLVYAKAGKTKKAIAAAKASLEGAKQANNLDYVKMNEDSLKEWGAW
ncbi:MAG: DUF2911 domain-containing protein [Flavobacteriaceae bacterium]|nr:DUF2911 domain-containing protein [Flavobacteriaceae bacterium]MCI5088516.1 DUF2911 domain-containing protein [Flavobacteriaceae bacterium]CAI8175325.1 MAG: Uncharacterised protein [SAR116 cluster bacterium]